MAKVALPLCYTTDQKPGSTFLLAEAIHIIEVDAVVVNRSLSNSSNSSKPKSNVSQHPAATTTTNSITHNNTTNSTNAPPQISAIALTGLSNRLNPSTNNNNNNPNIHRFRNYFHLTPQNGYTLTTINQHYTPPSTPLESLFMEATSCRSSQPAVETLVSVWNYIKDAKHPNGLFPPYQLGVSGDEGVLSVYRSYKGDDLNFGHHPSNSPGGNGAMEKSKMTTKGRKGVWWSDVMYEVWRKYSSPSTTTTPTKYLGRRTEATRLRYIAIPEVNNEEVKTIANYAFEKRGLEKDTDMLVVDRDDKCEGMEGWTLFDAFLGTASVKAINRMAMDHADELGYIVPARVYIKYSSYSCLIMINLML
ncbi:hypothetical protein TWF281_000338 [Arthrobotrys megalospora]